MEDLAPPQSQFAERRHFSRTKSRLNVDVTLSSGDLIGDQTTGSVINFSKEGVGAVLKKDVPPGTQVELTIFSNLEESVGSGQVVWRKEVNKQITHGIRIIRWSTSEPIVEPE